jgi:hypothetical protein
VHWYISNEDVINLEGHWNTMPKKTPGWSLWIDYEAVLYFGFKFLGTNPAKRRLPLAAKTFVREWMVQREVAEKQLERNPANYESICREDLTSFSDSE